LDTGPVKKEKAPTHRRSTSALKREERQQGQRERILEAARSQFIRHGFHAAGVAAIAEEAGISPALIYRYFSGKREIVLAIIESQMRANLEALDGLQLATDFVSELQDGFRLWGSGDPAVWNAALFSEITAEATRDEAVAGALAAHERRGREEFAAWLQRRDRQHARRQGAHKLQVRAVLMQCLVEGLAVRAAREPALDPKIVRDMLRQVLPLVLDPD
jgi:AcrR family transcriptional regulator